MRAARERMMQVAKLPRLPDSDTGPARAAGVDLRLAAAGTAGGGDGGAASGGGSFLLRARRVV